MNHKDEPPRHKEHEVHKENSRIYEPINSATEQVVREIIAAAIAVHRELGPGFVESAYYRAMLVELRQRRLRLEAEKAIQVHYRGELICHHRLDLLVEGAVVVEVKAVRKIRPVHHAQVLSYLKASGCRVGLLMNFNAPTLIDGLRRFIR